MEKIYKKICLVSACLIGLCTRYDAKLKKNNECLNHIDDFTWIPVCPEQLGGLPTPREAADISGGNGFDVLKGNAKVISKSGSDVTKEFITGAEQVLFIAQQQHITKAFLKSGSPSCGAGEKTGVTTALLRQNGVDVMEF